MRPSRKWERRIFPDLGVGGCLLDGSFGLLTDNLKKRGFCRPRRHVPALSQPPGSAYTVGEGGEKQMNHCMNRWNDRPEGRCGCGCGNTDNGSLCVGTSGNRDTGAPLVTDLAGAAERNGNYRKAIWTGDNLQVTLMSLNPCEDIGLEMHADTDQLLYVVSGEGTVQMGRCQNQLCPCRASAGTGIFVPAGTWHNLTNTGTTPLKLFSVYAPPEHPRGIVEETKPCAVRRRCGCRS